MNIAELLAPVIVAAFSGCIIYMLGHSFGRQLGRAEGWLERNQEMLDYERARRARDGKFRSVRGGVR